MLRLLVLLTLSSSAFAATPYKQTLSVKKNAYTADGVFTGGKAGEGSTLLGVRRAFSGKAKLERVIIDLGNHEAKADAANIGYFQVAMDSQNNQIVLDVAQLRLSKVTEQQLKTLFKSSPYVSDVSLTMDPEDKAATMVLQLKRPMKLEVFQLKNKKKPGRVVLDLTPRAVQKRRS